MKKTIQLLIYIVSTILLISCSNSPTNNNGSNSSSLQLSSSNGSYPIHVGINAQLTAIAIQNGSSTNVTNSANWSSSNTSIATVNNSGAITPISAGTVNITATFSGMQNSIKLTISNAQLQSINISSINYKLHLGISVPLTATGIFTDGTQDVTNLASWSSSNPSIVSVSNSSFHKHKKIKGQLGGILSPISQGTAIITASYNGAQYSDTVNISVSNAQLQSLDVTPNTTTTHIGVNTQFNASAIFSDGAQDVTNLVTWSSSNSSIASVNSQGIALASQSGLVLITGNLTLNNNQYTDSSSLNISGGTLQSIQITPNVSKTYVNTNQQFIATGIYSDGTQNISSSVAWASSNLNIMTILNNSNNGFATFLQAGNVNITAIFNGKQASNTIAVSSIQLQSITISIPNTELPIGITTQATATGTFNDGTQQNITNAVIWSSSNLSAVNISNTSNNNGIIQGETSGQSSNITASFINAGNIIVSNGITVNITNAQLTGINVTPNSASIQIGQNLQFTATGIFSSGQSIDLTSQALWSSSNTSYATISNVPNSNGLVVGTGIGQTNISASYAGITSQTPATLDVGAAGITSISITPNNSNGITGITQQFFAQAVLSDGSLVNISNSANWSSSNQTVATVTSTGSVTSLAAGTTNISATYQNVTGLSSYNIINYVYSGAQGGSGPINMYMINQSNGRLIALNPATINAASSIFGLAATPNNYFVYAANNTGNSISMYRIDPNTGLLSALNPATISTGGATNPRQIAITNDGKFLYATLATTNQVIGFSIDQTTGQLTNIGTFASSASTSGIAIASTSSGNYLYASGQSGNSVFMYSINPNTGVLTALSPASIATGSSPHSVAVTPNGKYLYTGTTGANLVYMFAINQASGLLSALASPTIASGTTPTGVFANNQYVYVACQSSGVSEYFIDSSGQLSPLNPAIVPAGTTAFGVIINPAGTYAYVSNQSSADIYMYTVTNGVLATQGNISASFNPSNAIIVR